MGSGGVGGALGGLGHSKSLRGFALNSQHGHRYCRKMIILAAPIFFTTDGTLLLQPSQLIGGLCFGLGQEQLSSLRKISYANCQTNPS